LVTPWKLSDGISLAMAAAGFVFKSSVLLHVFTVVF